MDGRYMKVAEYRRQHFQGKPPSANTIKKLIREGELAGRRIGNLYYVDMRVEDKTTGDSLVDAVLRG
jgi:hypothetical protein